MNVIVFVIAITTSLVITMDIISNHHHQAQHHHLQWFRALNEASEDFTVLSLAWTMFMIAMPTWKLTMMIIFINIIAGQWKYSWQRWWWREPGKMLSPARYPCSWWRIPCSAPGYIIMMNCCWWMMMIMMLTMPTGSNTQGGFDVSRWMERPVVDHLRVLFLRLRFWLFFDFIHSFDIGGVINVSMIITCQSSPSRVSWTPCGDTETA